MKDSIAALRAPYNILDTRPKIARQDLPLLAKTVVPGPMP